MSDGVLSYAGVGLPVPPRKLARWAARVLPADLDRIGPQPFPATRLGGFGPRQARRPRVGSLYWPTGASRWAVGHFLASETQLKAIRAALDLEDKPGNALPVSAELVMDTGRGAVRATMHLLTPLPLARHGGENGLYLLTLVDERWLWWGRVCGATVKVRPGVETWDDLIKQAQDALGVTVESTAPVDDAEWGVPPDGLDLGGEPAPAALDALLYAVGLRLSRAPDGGVTVRDFTADRQIQYANLHPEADDEDWPVEAGGTFALPVADADPPTDQVYALPKTVRHVVVGPAGPTQLDQDLADLADPDFPGPYRDAVRAYRVPRRTADAAADGLYLQGFATAYALRHLSAVQRRYAGVVPWEPEGLSDAVEWVYREGQAATVVLRPPDHDGVTDLIGPDPLAASKPDLHYYRSDTAPCTWYRGQEWPFASGIFDPDTEEPIEPYNTILTDAQTRWWNKSGYWPSGLHPRMPIYDGATNLQKWSTHATPFLCPQGRAIADLVVFINSYGHYHDGSGNDVHHRGLLRLGVYATRSTTDLRPGALIAQTDELDYSTELPWAAGSASWFPIGGALKTPTGGTLPNGLALAPDRLYWFAIRWICTNRAAYGAIGAGLTPPALFVLGSGADSDLGSDGDYGALGQPIYESGGPLSPVFGWYWGRGPIDSLAGNANPTFAGVAPVLNVIRTVTDFAETTDLPDPFTLAGSLVGPVPTPGFNTTISEYAEPAAVPFVFARFRDWTDVADCDSEPPCLTALYLCYKFPYRITDLDGTLIASGNEYVLLTRLTAPYPANFAGSVTIDFGGGDFRTIDILVTVTSDTDVEISFSGTGITGGTGVGSPAAIDLFACTPADIRVTGPGSGGGYPGSGADAAINYADFNLTSTIGWLKETTGDCSSAHFKAGHDFGDEGPG